MPLTALQLEIARLLAENRTEDSHLAGGTALHARPDSIRCLVTKGENSTKLEWAHDSAWRFMPVQRDVDFGYVLHPIDLAINKTLALAGRDEPRDFLDVMHAHRMILPLGAQVWAACGKDPGFNPSSLLELIRRRGKNRGEDLARLRLRVAIDLQALKQAWLSALEEAETFIERAPFTEIGCLYYSPIQQKFVAPDFASLEHGCVLHFGRLGGVLPRFA